MSVVSLFCCLIAIIFNAYTFIKAYESTLKTKAYLNIIHIILILFTSLVVLISNTYFSITLKITTSFIVLLLNFKIIFKEDLIPLLFKSFIIYFLLFLCDFLVSTIFLFFPVNSVVDLGKITILKALCTLLVSLLLMLLFLIKGFVTFVNKLLNVITDKQNVVILVLAFFTFALYIILGFLSAVSFSLEIYFVSLLVVLFLLFLCVVLIFQYFKNKHSEEEQEALLSLMSEYEKMLDNEKMNRHDMLNNLIIIKSFKDKTSKEFEVALDDTIKIYQDNKSSIYANLYKLPAGLKGIIYYKMAKIKENNINLVLLSASKVEDIINKMSSKLYFKVCKILGIILDNAIEASISTKERHLLIDIYYENRDLMIYIENSYKNAVNINEIYRKGFSSKGTNRGYGLYIVNKLVDETELLEFEQYIQNNKFVTILQIKNPSK